MGVTASETTVQTRSLVAAACDGDRHAFEGMIQPYWAELHAHCYRMLGSLHDADDALQEALLRSWRGLRGFNRGMPMRPWLYKIATNVCLDMIAKRPKGQVELGPTLSGGHSEDSTPDATWLEAYPDQQLGLSEGHASPEARYEQREAVELAFVAALQHLPPRQRAALIIREVLGFSATEVADVLETSTASVNSALQRARQTIAEQAPERSQHATIRSLGDARLRKIAQRFVDAFERADVQSILDLLAADVVFIPPPPEAPARGRGEVSESWLIPISPAGSLRLIPTFASGQLAFAVYKLDPTLGRFAALVLDVVSLRGDQIASVTAYLDTSIFSRLGLPDHVQ